MVGMNKNVCEETNFWSKTAQFYFNVLPARPLNFEIIEKGDYQTEGSDIRLRDLLISIQRPIAVK